MDKFGFDLLGIQCGTNSHGVAQPFEFVDLFKLLRPKPVGIGVGRNCSSNLLTVKITNNFDTPITRSSPKIYETIFSKTFRQNVDRRRGVNRA